jgi:hypothetical protein
MLGRCRRINIHRKQVHSRIEGKHIHAPYMVTGQVQRVVVEEQKVRLNRMRLPAR